MIRDYYLPSLAPWVAKLLWTKDACDDVESKLIIDGELHVLWTTLCSVVCCMQ